MKMKLTHFWGLFPFFTSWIYLYHENVVDCGSLSSEWDMFASGKWWLKCHNYVCHINSTVSFQLKTSFSFFGPSIWHITSFDNTACRLSVTVLLITRLCTHSHLTHTSSCRTAGLKTIMRALFDRSESDQSRRFQGELRQTLICMYTRLTGCCG